MEEGGFTNVEATVTSPDGVGLWVGVRLGPLAGATLCFYAGAFPYWTKGSSENWLAACVACRAPSIISDQSFS